MAQTIEELSFKLNIDPAPVLTALGNILTAFNAIKTAADGMNPLRFWLECLSSTPPVSVSPVTLWAVCPVTTAPSTRTTTLRLL